jgi:uncharacterized protein (DUF2267 family)
MLSEAELIRRVRVHAGCENDEEAVAAISATLRVLGQRLETVDVLDIELPERFRGLLSELPKETSFDLPDLYHRVAEHEETPDGFATEHAQVVLHVLGEVVDADGRLQLLAQLPATWTGLFSGPASSELPGGGNKALS